MSVHRAPLPPPLSSTPLHPRLLLGLLQLVLVLSRGLYNLHTTVIYRMQITNDLFSVRPRDC